MIVGNLVRLSPNDPWWVTALLLIARVIAALVMIWWVMDMVRRAPAISIWWRPWRLPWPWCLTWWLVAVTLTVLLNVGRVLLIGHIRGQTAIGQGFRVAEVVVALHLAAWSIVAAWRWSHPAPEDTL